MRPRLPERYRCRRGGTFGFGGNAFTLGVDTFAGSADVVGGTLTTSAAAIGGSVTMGGGTFNATAASTIGGFVTVSGGLFDASAASAIGGPVIVNGGELELGASTVTLAGSVAVGAGELEVGSGAVTVSGGFAQEFSIVDGTGTLTLAGGASFDGLADGDRYEDGLNECQTGSGTTVLQGATSVSGNGVALDGGRVLENQGTLTWAGGAFNLGFHPYATTIGGGTIANDAGATFAIECDGAVTVTSGTTAFINNGTLTKSGTSGISHIGVAVTNGGTVVGRDRHIGVRWRGPPASAR